MLRGLEFWVLAATTRPEPTIETPAKTSTDVNTILRLFKPLIQFPIQTPIDTRCSPKIRSNKFNPSRVRLRITLPQIRDAMRDV
jgi:hypothetical protein